MPPSSGGKQRKTSTLVLKSKKKNSLRKKKKHHKVKKRIKDFGRTKRKAECATGYEKPNQEMISVRRAIRRQKK